MNGFQLGIPASSFNRLLSPPAAAVSVGAPVASVALGEDHACALLSNGSVKCWGQGSSGQLGYGLFHSIVHAPLPAVVPVGATVAAIAAAAFHTCVITAVLRELRCWGDNAHGQARRFLLLFLCFA